jgi:uncharacterized protein YidB (DUF937 family)
LGNGHNEPVSGSEVRQALGADSINQLAERTGMPPEQASEHVARALPEMVDRATPQGQLPMEDPFSQGPESLKKLITR